MSEINQITFSQFYPLLWPGIVISLLGIFLITYYSKSKIIQALFCSVIPIILEIPVYFYSYIPSSDCGAARGMFHIFQKTGTNIQAISYFEFPNFFILDEIIRQTVGLNEKGIALICFTLYGILLSLFLFLVFFKQKKQSNYLIIPSVLVIIYFIGMYSLLNYQWVPQTLALVHFFLLLLISSYLLLDTSNIKWKFMFILIFTSLIYTHAFIPVLFLAFFGILIFKKRDLTPIFSVILFIYLVNTLYYTISNINLYIHIFRQSIQGFGGEYTKIVSSSFRNTGNIAIIDQLLGIFNGIKFSMIWLSTFIGSLVLFFKKKMNVFFIALGFSGGVYIATGAFFSVLGLRATQILFIPLTIGFIFFISKWRKPAIALIVVILILAVSGPMRSAYNQTAFQIDEEVYACDFLANTIKNVTNLKVGINQVNWGYFTNKLTFLKNVNAEYYAIRPGSKGFLNVFNGSLNQNHYILYNPNLGKEIIMYRMTKEDLIIRLDVIINNNNKLYHGGTTFILNGINGI